MDKHDQAQQLAGTRSAYSLARELLELRAERDGWQLVPVEATRRMMDAAELVEEDGYHAMYSAMLAAAPKPEAPCQA